MKCPGCGAQETESGGPRTTYACGTSSYDDRPTTWAGTCAETADPLAEGDDHDT